VALLILLLPQHLRAQGLPVSTGSHIPVALWFASSGVLGVVMLYGILHTRRRTRAQKQIIEQATTELYSDTERRRRRSGNP
jgi:hypothetical protein